MISTEGNAMFRQVVAIRWAEAVSPQAKQAYRDALDALCQSLYNSKRYGRSQLLGMLLI